MKKSDIYEIAIKILGLYMLMTTVIGTLHEYLTLFAVTSDSNSNTYGTEQPSYTPYLVIAIGNLLLMLVLSLLFIFKTRAIVKIICSTTDFEENVKLFADQKVVYEIAITMTALIIILWTLPEFGVKLKNYIQVEKMQGKGWHTTFDTNFLITSGTKIIVGLFILVSVKPLANYFGMNKQQSEDRNLNDKNSNESRAKA